MVLNDVVSMKFIRFDMYDARIISRGFLFLIFAIILLLSRCFVQSNLTSFKSSGAAAPSYRAVAWSSAWTVRRMEDTHMGCMEHEGGTCTC